MGQISNYTQQITDTFNDINTTDYSVISTWSSDCLSANSLTSTNALLKVKKYRYQMGILYKQLISTGQAAEPQTHSRSNTRKE